MATTKTFAQKLTPSLTRKLKKQRTAAYFAGGVCLTLTSLSLSHLAHGFGIVTSDFGWQSWAMAVGVDLGFVSLEAAELCSSHESIRKRVRKYTRPTIIGTIALSAVMNAIAFAEHAVNDGRWGMAAFAAVLGIAVPVLIYVTARVAADLFLGSYRK